MGDLDPIAFDIETSGFGDGSVLTVGGFASTLGEIVILNTAGREANSTELEHALIEYSAEGVDVVVTDDQADAVDDAIIRLVEKQILDHEETTIRLR